MASMSLVFDLLARDKGASKTFREVGDSAEKAGKKGAGFGSSIKGAMGVAAGAIAAAGLGRAFTGFISDAAEAAKIGRLTAAVVKSTGGAAKITADQVASLSEAISNKTAVDDEAIQSGANLLLTFTKVRNEVGAGNDIFNQAAQAAVDMSVALGTDITGASLQLGKALNDPIKGVTALSRAGVSFTEQQKDQIRTMVEAGDVLGAQKIILGEMATQFGGAAEAAAAPLDRLKVIAGNLGEQVGGILLPHIERFATHLSGTALPAVSGFLAGLEGRGSIDGFSGALNTLGLGLRATVAAFKDGDVTSDGFVGAMERVGVTVRGVTDFVRNNTDLLKGFAVALGVGAVAVGVLTAAQGALNIALSANPIGIVVVALAGLVAGLVVAYQRSAEFRAGVDQVWESVKAFAGTLRENALPLMQRVGAFLADTFRPAFASIARTVREDVMPQLAGLRDILERNRPELERVAQGVGLVVGVMAALYTKAQAFVLPILAELAAFLFGRFLSVIGSVITAVGDFVRFGESLGRTFITARDRAGDFMDKLDRFKLPGWIRTLADTVSGIAGNLGSAAGRVAGLIGDGPGRAGVQGGSTLARVRPLLPSGAVITSTYRNAAMNRAAGGSPSSYHMDRNNPAVDIAGSRQAMDLVHARLAAIGGWRELLYKTKGHWDHVHVAHKGGMVSPSWPSMPGWRSDERPARLQVGETVLPKGAGAGVTITGNTFVNTSPDGFAEALQRQARRQAAVTGLRRVAAGV